VSYLIEHHRDLIDAGFALNEGGGGRYDIKTGVYRYVAVLAPKRLPGLHAEHPTTRAGTPRGHARQTRSINCTPRSTRLKRSVKVEFNDTSRSYFEKFGAIEGARKAPT